MNEKKFFLLISNEAKMKLRLRRRRHLSRNRMEWIDRAEETVGKLQHVTAPGSQEARQRLTLKSHAR